LEEENQVFGVEAENKDAFNSEEKFNIYHKDKEDAEKNIQASAKELNDFFDSLIKDEPDPTEEEVNEGIRKILERAYPEKKTNKSKKVALKVLFIAALLSVLSFSCLFVVGNSHNISIENGFVTFAKDTVRIVFFGEAKEEYITIDALLDDLSSNGFKSILLPQELYNNYKSSKPEYYEEEDKNNIVVFNISDDTTSYSFRIEKAVSDRLVDNSFSGLDNAETMIFDDVYVYIFEHENGVSYIRFIYCGYDYFIQSDNSFPGMINIAKTIIKAEE
jgi:hypothetical protein